MWLDPGYGSDLDNQVVQNALDEMTPEQARAYREELKNEDPESYEGFVWWEKKMGYDCGEL